MMHKGGENCEGEENLRMVQFPNLLPLEHEIRFRESRVPSGHGFIYRLDSMFGFKKKYAERHKPTRFSFLRDPVITRGLFSLNHH